MMIQLSSMNLSNPLFKSSQLVAITNMMTVVMMDDKATNSIIMGLSI